MAAQNNASMIHVEDPAFARALFSSTRYALVWAVIRVYLGYTWFLAGFDKLGNPAWMQTGEALRSFWARAIALEPRPPIAFGWYRSFIEFLLAGGHYSWFAPLVVIGELLVGAALIIGAFTGIAAFLGGFMNFNFMMAGTASTNPLLFTLAILLILGWKVAGYIGADRWLLPPFGDSLGTCLGGTDQHRHNTVRGGDGERSAPDGFASGR